MTVTEQGCAELAERLRKAARQKWCVTKGAGEPDHVTCLVDQAILTAAATILSRLTVEELAGVIGEADEKWFGKGTLERGTFGGRQTFVAQALLDHITAETEVKA